VKGIRLVLIALLCASAIAQQANQKQQQKPDLKETVKWAVWHEGCRIYASDNSLGDAEQIRECIAGVYAQNDEAQQMVQAATNAQLLVAVRMAGREIPAERGIRERVAYACKHENLLESFVDLESKNDYEGIRTLYYSTFKADENVRNLLAAVSDEALGDLINENK
jgi:hypothetical protein